MQMNLRRFITNKIQYYENSVDSEYNKLVQNKINR